MSLRRTDQIGPSGHVASYCSAVKIGNWAEERLLIEATNKPQPVFKLESTAQASYSDPALRAAGASLKPPSLCRAADAGQNLLLGHAKPPGAAAPTNGRRAPRGPVAVAGMPPKQVDALQKKQQRWAQERDCDFSRGGVPPVLVQEKVQVRVKAPHFVHQFSDDPSVLQLRQ